MDMEPSGSYRYGLRSYRYGKISYFPTEGTRSRGGYFYERGNRCSKVNVGGLLVVVLSVAWLVVDVKIVSERSI